MYTYESDTIATTNGATCFYDSSVFYRNRWQKFTRYYFKSEIAVDSCLVEIGYYSFDMNSFNPIKRLHDLALVAANLEKQDRIKMSNSRLRCLISYEDIE